MVMNTNRILAMEPTSRRLTSALVGLVMRDGPSGIRRSPGLCWSPGPARREAGGGRLERRRGPEARGGDGAGARGRGARAAASAAGIAAWRHPRQPGPLPASWPPNLETDNMNSNPDQHPAMLWKERLWIPAHLPDLVTTFLLAEVAHLQHNNLVSTELALWPVGNLLWPILGAK